ncbi:MAG TPA: thioredoxin [Phycisphaerae bacterium]|nr:thioredoxin [Phycisphaerae bacterium]
MASEKIVEITDDNFDAEAVQSDLLVLVDFWAEWCGPCRAIAPLMDQLAEEYAGKVKFGKLNVDNARQTAVKYGIQSIPTLLILKGGQVVAKVTGARPKGDIKAAIDRNLA